MNPHQMIRFYFECLNDAGEQVTFDLIKQKKETNETITYNHLIYDGLSALCEQVATFKGENIIPKLHYQAPPSFLKRMVLLTQWWTAVSYRSFFVPRGDSQEESLYGSRVVTIKDEKNLNSRILMALHQALETNETSLWMLPVSLHKKVELGMKPLNNVSFIDVKLKSNDTANDVKEKIARELKSGSYWGTIYSMFVPKILGKKMFIKTFPYFSHFLKRTGTFSNLGKWTIPGIPEEESWGIKLTVVSLNPLAASALQVNGKLTIGLQTHSCLGLTKQKLDRILDLWQKALQNQSPS
jgi:hypothetical protein